MDKKNPDNIVEFSRRVLEARTGLSFFHVIPSTSPLALSYDNLNQDTEEATQ